MVSRHTVTLANSIVGVSVLAMPFCFKQCGIVLATLSLMMGAIMTRMVCYFLLKAALMSRRRTYEMLAWSTFGQTGKFMVEISIIGFLIGTLIAFMVVIGDLGPEILSEMFSVENNSSLRTITMTALSLFVALPLGLLRNIDSLSSVSTASVLFYLFLVLKVLSEGIGPLWSGEYLERIHFWRSGGVLQCIPIFSMALSCQTQIFGIYDALPEPSLQKMNEIVKQAVNICTFFYFCVGFFGYIAFSQHNFGGNILLSFTPAWSTQLIKSMFLMSVVFSVPLVVFPCRSSLHSMIFKSGGTYHQVHDITTNYIPESRLKFLTVTIVGATLIIGILIPNIELVLGLVGSTTGSVICIIFPSIMFVRVTSKNTTERLLAQGMFCIGVVLMLLTTYATLYAAEQSQISEKIPDPIRVTEDLLPLKPIARHDDVQLNSPLSKIDEGKIEKLNRVEFQNKSPEKEKKSDQQRNQFAPSKVEISSPKVVVEKASQLPIKTKIKAEANKLPPKNVDSIQELHKDPVKVIADGASKPNLNDPIPSPRQTFVNKNDVPPLNDAVPSKDTIAGAVEMAPETDTKKEFVDKQVAEAFLKKLEEHQENQKKLLEEQKEILEELKQHHAQDVREKIEKEKIEKPEGVLDQKLETIDKQEPNVQNIAASASDTDNDVHGAAKITQEQEKIIAKLSENIDKESQNVQLLEKLEEGLNKEVKMMDSHKTQKIDEPSQKVKTQQQEKHLMSEKIGAEPDQQQSFASAANPIPQKVIEVHKESKVDGAIKDNVIPMADKVDSIIHEKKESTNLNKEIHVKKDNVAPINSLNVNVGKNSAVNSDHPKYDQNAHRSNIVASMSNAQNKAAVVSEDSKKNVNAEVSSDKKTGSEKEKVDREM